jgi:hypothetical protein
LGAGHPLRRHLNPEIAAGHHQAVGDARDRLEIRQGIRALDLGDQAGTAGRPGKLPRQAQVVLLGDEAEAEEVDTLLHPPSQIGPVDLGQRAALDRGAGQGDALPPQELAAAPDLANGDAPSNSLDQEFDQPVGNENPGANLNRVEELGEVDADAGGGGRLRRIDHLDLAAAGDGNPLTAGEGAGSDLEAAQVEQDRHHPPHLGGDRAHILDHPGPVVGRAVGGVDADDIDPGFEQRRQGFAARGGRPQGGDDLYAALIIDTQPGPLSVQVHGDMPRRRRKA